MIKRIKVLKEIGRFSALTPTQGTEGDFSSLNVIYAGNACGKSTLCDVFRSLDTGNPDYVIGRKRIGANTQPEVVMSTIVILHLSYPLAAARLWLAS